MDAVTEYAAIVAFSPIATLQRANADHANERTMAWTRDSLRLLDPAGVPLLVDHDLSRVIGRVHGLTVYDWTDGPWICANAVVTDPDITAWAKTFRTRASFGYVPVAQRDDRITCGIVTEVSLLHGQEPAEPGAQLLRLEPVVERSRAAASPDAAGEPLRVQGVLRRPAGQILGVR